MFLSRNIKIHLLTTDSESIKRKFFLIVIFLKNLLNFLKNYKLFIFTDKETYQLIKEEFSEHNNFEIIIKVNLIR